MSAERTTAGVRTLSVKGSADMAWAVTPASVQEGLGKSDITEEYRQEILTYRQIRDRGFGRNPLTLVSRDKLVRQEASRRLTSERQ